MWKKVLRIAAIIACVIVIIYEAVHIYQDRREYSIAVTEYEKIAADTVSVVPVTESSEEIRYPQLNINYDELKNINSDFIAWLYMPCLELSYPVVREQKVDEYLYKTFDGTNNKSGCLFEDIMSDPYFEGMHDIVFGHNMKNNTMFGRLKEIHQDGGEELVNNNPYVYIYTPYAVYEYRIFAYYVTGVGSDAYSVVTTADEYDTFLDFIKVNTLYNIPSDIDFDERPNLLTLSTCSGTSGNGKRFVVHTVRTGTWNAE